MRNGSLQAYQAEPYQRDHAQRGDNSQEPASNEESDADNETNPSGAELRTVVESVKESVEALRGEVAGLRCNQSSRSIPEDAYDLMATLFKDLKAKTEDI